MQKVLSFFIGSLLVFSCSQRPDPDSGSPHIKFTASLHPAFNESAEIIFSKHDSGNMVSVLLRDISRGEKMPDTFYYVMKRISNKLFREFDSSIIQKTFIVQPKQWEGCCDGMPIYFSTSNGTDTSGLYFRSPHKNSDTIGYRITQSMIDFFRKGFKDSIVNDYLDDIQAYMDGSKFRKADAKRKIDQLRMRRYNWTIQGTAGN